MNAIFPIFIEDDFDSDLLWDEINGTPLFFVLIEKLIQSDACKVFVLTDQMKIVEYLSNLCIDSYYIKDIKCKSDQPYLHALAYQSFKYLQSRTDLSEHAVNLVLDCRNPGLSNQILKKAVAEFTRSKDFLLASVIVVRDHPMQLDLYYQILETEMICLVNPGFIPRLLENGKVGTNDENLLKNNSFFALKPFYYKWNSYGIESGRAGGIYYRSNHSTISPLKKIENDHRVSQNNLYLYYLNQDNAVRLIGGNLTSLNDKFLIKGLSFQRNCRGMSFILAEHMESRDDHIFINETLWHDDIILRQWHFKMDRSYVNPPDSRLPVGKQLEAPLHFHGSHFHGPLPIGKIDHAVTCVTVALLQVVEEDCRADIYEQITGDVDLWQLRQATQHSIKTSKRNVIIGRQDFPDIYSIDGSFCIFRGKHIEYLESQPKSKCIQGFVLEGSASVKIRNNIDLIRLKQKLGVN